MACANLAGLLLARREEDCGPPGAKRQRLIRQLPVEAALLSIAGAAAGLAVYIAGVLTFTIALTFLTILLFVLAPAFAPPAWTCRPPSRTRRRGRTPILAAGSGAAWALSRVGESKLFGGKPHDRSRS
jgi:hypothetical protein